MRIQSIQVSGPVTHFDVDLESGVTSEWTTSFWKQPWAGEIEVFQGHLDGDGQADMINHGGDEKAILGYSAEHYPSWQLEYPNVSFGPGGFGENFTIEGANEKDVCIGDIVRVGEVVLQVSQPRIPCWKISRRWQTPSLTEAVRNSLRTGWYYRVLATGKIRVGASITLEKRPHPEMTILRLNEALHRGRKDNELWRSAAACDDLAKVWREIAKKKNAESDGHDNPAVKD